MNSLKICMVGLKCFDQLADRPVPRYLGGIETQLATLAKGLVKEGCQVSLITYDHGQGDEECFDGVKVLKSHPPTGGIPMLRWLHPRSTRLWRAMRRADADIYLQMGAGSETGTAALGCSLGGRKRKRFVFCLASDANYGKHLRAGRLGWEGLLYRQGLRRADRIVAQTLRQQQGLRHAVGLESQVIPMATACPWSGSAREGLPHPAKRVLWVGRITPEKRLEYLLDAARHCPEISFEIVGTPNKASEYATRLLDYAARLPNVKAHGRLSRGELNKLYLSCRLLCCTSTLEGFPTTFLEAWSCGLPVVTTFDPDETVERHGLGRVAISLDEVVLQIREMLGDAEAYARVSRAARQYYLENHTVEAVSRRFRLIFEELALRPGHGEPGVAGGNL